LTGKPQLDFAGSPLQLKLTGWLNPAMEVNTTVNDALPPAVTVALGDTDPIEKSCC
jgi:hypothetical protein